MRVSALFALASFTSIVFIASHTFAINTTDEVSTVRIPTGKYKPFEASTKKSFDGFLKPSPIEVVVPQFLLDRFPVTNRKFLDFVKSHPEWRRSTIKRLFADSHYLEKWPSDLDFGHANGKRPVTQVSWFAASAYCESIGKELPTTDQWEYALFDNGRGQEKLKEKIIEWYGRPNEQSLAVVGGTGQNAYGISDLGSLVWEWTQDFNSFLSGADSRDSSGKDANLYCGNGSQLGDASNYAAFMRFSFRASLKANYTTANLGFRCAKEFIK